MHVVQVSPFPGNSNGGGASQRIHGLMTGRKPTDEVTRVVIETPDSVSPDVFDYPTIKSFDSNYSEIKTCNLPRAVLNAILAPFNTSVYDHVWMPLESSLLRFARTGYLHKQLDTADVVVTEFPWQIEYIRSIVTTGTPVIYSSHNIEVEYHDSLIGSYFAQSILERMRRVECNAVRNADLTITVSKRDQQAYRERYAPAEPIDVVPNGAYLPDLNRFAYEVSANETFVAIFVGTAHGPNITAVKNILQIARQIDEVEFRVCGTVCDSITHQEIPTNVSLLGYRDNLAAELVAADVGLNPITQGGGSNIKLLEYLAHGLPVLTTQFGARGVPVTDGSEVIIREITAFPETLRAMRTGRIDSESVGKRGRQLIVSGYNWSAISARLFTRLREITG